LTRVRSRLTAVTVGLGAALAPTTAWAAHSRWIDTVFPFLVAAVAFLGTWAFLALLERWRRARRRHRAP
jgi:hypothetical protein